MREMQTLLNDIELDIQELKYLLQAVSGDANPALRIVAKRSIRQMKMRLDALQDMLDAIPASPIPVSDPVADVSSVFEQPIADLSPQPMSGTSSPFVILAERIRPSADLRHAISLNDSFRFARELFGGDTVRMNEVVERLGQANSLEKAVEIAASELRPDEENEAFADFLEILKKYFS